MASHSWRDAADGDAAAGCSAGSSNSPRFAARICNHRPSNLGAIEEAMGDVSHSNSRRGRQ